MTNVLPLYVFAPCHWFSVFSMQDKAVIEVCEHWVKQSLRSRYEIAGPNGRQSLSVPTNKASRKLLKDVTINYSEDWVTNHLRSVKTAYNRSPFYEFYAHDFERILRSKPTYLMDLSIASLEFGITHLQLETSFVTSQEYAGPSEITPTELTAYSQVFEEKNGFISGLSFLDLLFNCGPSAGSMLG